MVTRVRSVQAPSSSPMEAALEALVDGAEISVGGVDIGADKVVREAVRAVLDARADGRLVAVTAVDEFLTTGEVARLLGVSRPTVVKLVDDGVLTDRGVGVHRRIPAVEVTAFLAGRRQRRAEAIADVRESLDLEEPDEMVRTR